MVPFETSGVTWQQLSAIYSAAYFGALEPTQAQVDAFWLFDSTFYRACRKHVGIPAYLRIFFRL
ncbi:MAG: hypothetical protein LUG13_08655 [Oscillospiraceae bacterium]|nr:hypothetical protein [Oscillospiraceae bacterium]